MPNIRDNAIHCEVRKIAYRQSKDGVVISFVIHPNEVPDHLATANLGSRFMMALVEIGDDEQPAKAGQPLAKKRLVQQAAIACTDELFRRWLDQTAASTISEEEAAVIVRDICGVSSRSEITLGSPAAEKWDRLWGKFLVWKQT